MAPKTAQLVHHGLVCAAPPFLGSTDSLAAKPSALAAPRQRGAVQTQALAVPETARAVSHAVGNTVLIGAVGGIATTLAFGPVVAILSNVIDARAAFSGEGTAWAVGLSSAVGLAAALGTARALGIF